MTTQDVDRRDAQRFLEDYGVPPGEAARTLDGLSAGTLFSALFTYASRAEVTAASDDRGWIIRGRYRVAGGPPDAGMLYQHTLDGLYEGESDGDADSPSGWFAKIRWPWHDQGWYLIQQDSDGFTSIIATGDATDSVYAFLTGEYTRWCEEEEDEEVR